ncbi:MAG: recombinase RecA, partial [Hyphococcus sp.]
FSYNSERIGQGRENAKQFLRDNPDMADDIERAIRQNAGLVAEEMLTGESAGDGDDLDAAEAS